MEFLCTSGITRLNDRARQDAAVLRLGFLKLDARAREDTRKIDLGVKEKAARLKHLATDRAQSDLKRVADQHWSDGALEMRSQQTVCKPFRKLIGLWHLPYCHLVHDSSTSLMALRTIILQFSLGCNYLTTMSLEASMQLFGDAKAKYLNPYLVHPGFS
ncbi:hypothetical protein ZIOFF_065606 [Zingiber officinale]|uniref:Uncharacterized protein n=1 Tax=Zingiber officinale TaxID=94328 RepID=A0A8J5EXB3_ZINOF|nr:hypothetical protein ZIOFF_065606 [Zingiber officinale]